MFRRVVVPIVCCLCGGMSLGCASMSPRNMIPWTFETKQEKIDRLLNVARLHERHDQMDEATQIYQQVLLADAKNVMARHRLGVIAVRDGRLADAQEHMQQAIALGQPSAELLGDMGYLYYLRHDLPAAEAQIRAALQLDPRDRRARNNLGLVLGEQGHFDEALAEFRQGGSEAEALANLAYVQSQMGALGEAEKNYHQALDRDKTLRSAAEALVQLSEMKAKLTGAGNKQVAQVQHTENSPPVSQFSQEPAPPAAPAPTPSSDNSMAYPKTPNTPPPPAGAPFAGTSAGQMPPAPAAGASNDSGVVGLPGLPKSFTGPRLPTQVLPSQPTPGWQAPPYSAPSQALPAQPALSPYVPAAPYTPVAPTMPAMGN